MIGDVVVPKTYLPSPLTLSLLYYFCIYLYLSFTLINELQWTTIAIVEELDHLYHSNVAPEKGYALIFLFLFCESECGRASVGEMSGERVSEREGDREGDRGWVAREWVGEEWVGGRECVRVRGESGERVCRESEEQREWVGRGVSVARVVRGREWESERCVRGPQSLIHIKRQHWGSFFFHSTHEYEKFHTYYARLLRESADYCCFSVDDLVHVEEHSMDSTSLKPCVVLKPKV
jgi:hypothetical protein